MQQSINEFIEEQRKGLAELLANLGKSRVAAARSAARQSAARIKELNGRVRRLAKSGVRLTAVSQGAAQGLIELHAEIVTSALTDAASQLERMAYTESVRDLARMQSEVLQATRQRIVGDMSRVLDLLRTAAGDARKVVAEGKAQAKAKTPAKPAAKSRSAPKKRAAARKAAAPARRKTPAKASARRRPRKTARR